MGKTKIVFKEHSSRTREVPPSAKLWAGKVLQLPGEDTQDVGS